MRIFWSIIALLVISTACLVAARRMRPADAPARTKSAPVTDRAEPSPLPQAVPEPIAQPVPTPTTTPPVPPTTPPVTAANDPAPTQEPESAATTPNPTPTPPIDPPLAPASPIVTDDPAASPPITEAPTSSPAQPTTEATSAPDAPTPPATIVTPSSSSTNPRARPTASPEDIAAAESVKGPPTLVKQADGTTLIADRFVIKGEGTKESPYEVTWEQLMSAQQTYKPRLGLKIIPGWLNIIHDKWVKVSGYVAFPVMAQGPDEMLMMLNQWDGCCIGVPPTPYDAIEVKLDKPAEGETRLLVMGTVTGKLKVDPYLVKDWLVSLYIMDEATVAKQSGVPLRDATIPQEHLAP